MDQTALFAGLAQIARQAGAAIMDIYSRPIAVTTKDDASPLTEADLASDAVIARGLAALTPAIPVISEEAVAQGQIPDISGGRFWLVDPLDGTKEFIRRNGEFTVNIGLIDQGVPTFGALYVPAQDRLFLAAPGLALLEEAGQPARPIHCRVPPSEGVTLLSSRSHRNPDQFDAYIQSLNVTVAGTAFAGSALKFALIAAGEADLYPRFGPTSEWDTAAGHALLLAAGGSLTLTDGGVFAYGKPKFLNPGFIARGRIMAYPPTPQG